MARELTEKDLRTRRLKGCVERFPRAETGEFHRDCCRFPKPCSPYAQIEAYQAGNLTERDLEPADRVPIRFEAAANPETDLPVPLDPGPVVTEKKTLGQLRIGSSFIVKNEVVDDAIAWEMDAKRIAMEAYIVQEHLADDIYEEKVSFLYPVTWWDHYKLQHQSSWWGRWLNKHFPARTEVDEQIVRVQLERYVNYPEADIEIPRLGHPVPYERLKRLSPGEIEEMDTQKELEAKREVGEDDIMTYLVVPEMFNELSEQTGLPVEHFQDLYNYDQEFGLNSKVYLIPDGR